MITQRTIPSNLTTMATSASSSSISFRSSSVFLSSPNNPTPQKLHFLKNKPSSSSSATSLSLSVRSELSATITTTTLPVLSPSNGTLTGAITTLTLKSAPPSTARAVVHRGITTDLTNRRRGTASTLTRAEVSGGGSKPYPQKKTGRARRGSQRTPLRPGGGVVFRPKPKDRSIKINKKEKRLAISTALASAANESVIVVEVFDKVFEDKPKTKEFLAMMGRLGLEKSVFLMNEVSENVKLSGRNIGTVKMLTPRTLNLFDVLDAENLVLTKGAVEFLNERYGDDEGEYFDDEEEVEDDGEEGDEESGDIESSA